MQHIVQHRHNRGLAAVLQTGIEGAAAGADIIVNTDGDNQYAGQDIGRLVALILAGEVDIVVGDQRCRARRSRRLLLRCSGSGAGWWRVRRAFHPGCHQRLPRLAVRLRCG